MSTFQKHLASIESGKITRSNIIGIRKAFNAFEKSRRWGGSWKAPAMTADEYSRAESLIDRFHPTALGELHEGGLKVLRNPRYAKRWNEREQRIIAGAARFDLIRFDWLNATHCVPVFRVISRDCESFAFRNVPWQTAWAMGEEGGPRVQPDNLGEPDLGEMPRVGMS